MAFLRVLFSPMGKRLVKLPRRLCVMKSSYYDEFGQHMTDSSPDEQARLHTQVLGSSFVFEAF